jgi:hypothetical protein
MDMFCFRFNFYDFTIVDIVISETIYHLISLTNYLIEDNSVHEKLLNRCCQKKVCNFRAPGLGFRV